MPSTVTRKPMFHSRAEVLTIEQQQRSAILKDALNALIERETLRHQALARLDPATVG